jgi:hypothetical protein
VASYLTENPGAYLYNIYEVPRDYIHWSFLFMSRSISSYSISCLHPVTR